MRLVTSIRDATLQQMTLWNAISHSTSFIQQASSTELNLTIKAMKRYITTIKIEVYAESDESAIQVSNNITESIKRKHNPNTELDSVQEFRFYGFNNRHLDLMKKQQATSKSQTSYYE